MKKAIILLFGIFTVVSFSYADDKNINSEKQPVQVGVDEKLGNYIPSDLFFLDSDGNNVRVVELIKRAPSIILPVYFSCPNVCNILLSSFANLIPQIKLKPGLEYQVLSISFDELDTPEIAKNKKLNYMAALKDFPADSWIFLTGDKENIKKFMDAIGFKFRRKGKDFIHPVTAVIASKDGKIVRYLYGTRILPFDLNMALIEAQKGEVGFSVKRVLSYCFSYDSKGKRYVFSIMKVSGTLILGMLLLFLIALVFSGKKKDMRGKNESK